MDISTVFDSYFDEVYRFYYHKTFHQHDAEDLTSRTFLIVAKKWTEEIQQPRAYVFGIAKMVWMEFLREKYSAPEFLADIDLLSSPWDNNSGDDNVLTQSQFDIHAVIEQLPDRQKRVIELRYINRLSLQEIADYVGKDVNYVKTTHGRALRRMREMIGGEYA